MVVCTKCILLENFLVQKSFDFLIEKLYHNFVKKQNKWNLLQRVKPMNWPPSIQYKCKFIKLFLIQEQKKINHHYFSFSSIRILDAFKFPFIAVANHRSFYANSWNLWFFNLTEKSFPWCLHTCFFDPRCTKPNMECLLVCSQDAPWYSTLKKIFTIFNFPTWIFSKIKRSKKKPSRKIQLLDINLFEIQQFENLGVQSWVWLYGRINWQNLDFIQPKSRPFEEFWW